MTGFLSLPLHRTSRRRRRCRIVNRRVDGTPWPLVSAPALAAAQPHVERNRRRGTACGVWTVFPIETEELGRVVRENRISVTS